MAAAEEEKNEKGGLPNLVIVGASVGGGYILRQLISSGKWAKFNTTVIDRNDYLEWFLSFDRYICDETLTKKHLLTTAEYFEKNKMSKYNIRFVQGTVINITCDGVERGGLVEYKTTEETLDSPNKQPPAAVSQNGGTVHHPRSEEQIPPSTTPHCNYPSLPYHYLVIATGAQYGSPIKDHTRLKSDRLSELSWWRNRISSADVIIVVGGGPVGVEMAGGLAYTFRQQDTNTKKKVHLTTQSKHLLSRLPLEAGKYAHRALENLGVIVHLGKSGEDLKSELSSASPSCDIVMLPESTSVNSSFLENSTFRGSIAHNGAIKVNSFMQVTPSRNVFALGDCCVTPLHEEKGLFSIAQLGKVVLTNLVNKQDGERLISVPPRTELMQELSIGREDGLMVLNWKLVKTGAKVAKTKDEAADRFGDLDEEIKADKKQSSLIPILTCLSSALCCGCSISSRARENEMIRIENKKREQIEKHVNGQTNNGFVHNEVSQNGHYKSQMANGHSEQH